MRLNRTLKQLAIRVLVMAATLVCCLFVLELGLRVLGEAPSNTTDGFFLQHGESYRLRPNLTKLTRWPGYTYVVHTNELGHRDRQQGPVQIEGKLAVFLGASQTFGNGVDYDDSFVGIVDDRLRPHGVDAVNLAVGGHNIIDQLLILEDFYNQVTVAPETVIICLNPLMLTNFDEGHEQIVVKGGYLFNSDSWLVPYLRVMAGNVSASYTFLRNSVQRVRATQAGETIDTVRPFFDLYGPEHRLRDHDTVLKLYERLDELLSLGRSRGSGVALVYLPAVPGLMVAESAAEAGLDPTHYDAYLYDGLLQTYASSRDVPLINPHEQLLAELKTGTQLTFDADAHYNKVANRLVADVVSEALLGSPELCMQKSTSLR